MDQSSNIITAGVSAEVGRFTLAELSEAFFFGFTVFLVIFFFAALLVALDFLPFLESLDLRHKASFSGFSKFNSSD